MSDAIGKESLIPYLQLEGILTYQIKVDRFSDGKLPSEKAMSLRYGI